MAYSYDAVISEDESLVKAYDKLSKSLTEFSKQGYEPYGETDVIIEQEEHVMDIDAYTQEFCVVDTYQLVQKVRRPAEAQPTPKEMLDTYIEQTSKLMQLGAEIVEALRGDK